MYPRFKLRSGATPLVMAGAFWATTALAPVTLGAGHGPIVNRGGAQTPPPCSPDGVCVPRPQTFGWYQTRWRTFPGDVAAPEPTAADGRVGPERPELGGPQLPPPTEEGQTGPTPSRQPGEPGAPAEGEEPAEDAAGAGLGTLPGESPLEGLDLPGVGAPAPGPDEGAAPDEAPQPGAEPSADPLDPFGPSSAAPPTPPAWITNAAAQRAALQEPASPALPVVEYAVGIDEALGVPAPVLPAEIPSAPAVVLAAVAEQPGVAAEQPPVQANMPVVSGPNLHSDDAPPVLPPALMNSVGQASAAAPVRTAPAEVQQPPSVQPVVIDDQVEAASMEQPMGIQLINPAAAEVDPTAEGLQQAIYFEASDQ